jgi:membrane protein DedA with SNARE-associated domain
MSSLPVASLSSSVTHAVGSHGIYAIFALMLLDAVFPAASELVMLYAGALAAGAIGAQHVVLFGSHLDGASAYLAAAGAGTLGYLVGSWLGWAIGRAGGRPLLERHGRLLHLPPPRLARAERWFARYRSWAVLLGRVTPVARSFVSIPAGVFRTPFAAYSLLTAVGSAIWAFALAGAGYALGSGYQRFDHGFRYAEYAVVAAAALLALALAARLRHRARERQLAPVTDAPAEP